MRTSDRPWRQYALFRSSDREGVTENTHLGGPSSNWGIEGAIGFDWQGAAMAPWHLSGQFRYGSALKSRGFVDAMNGAIGASTTFNATATGNESLREDHWLVDFNVGRDFGVGNSNAQWTLGVRVADLRSKLTANGNFNAEINGAPTASGPFSAQEKSTFLGAGPRLGVVGDTPLGGAWSFDWLAGAAVLFGERRLQRQASAATPTVTVISLTNSDSATVFNLDAEAGLSYWLNPNMKVTASYRFDGYFNAIKTFDTNGNLVDVNRYYQGPMLRFTSKF